MKWVPKIYVRTASPLPEAYTQLTVWQQRRMDWRIYRRLLGSLQGVCALLATVMLYLLALWLMSHISLPKWQADGLRLFPIMSFWLWVSWQRRRHLFAIFNG